MFELPKLADLKIKKEAIIHSADVNHVLAAEPNSEKIALAKTALFHSAVWLLGEHLRAVIEPHYNSAADMANMMGDDVSVEVEKAFGQPAGSLDKLVALKSLAYLPKAGDEGKWLAKFGIVDADWYALAGVAHDALDIPEHLRREAPAKPTQAEAIAEHVLAAAPIPPAPPLAEPIAMTDGGLDPNDTPASGEIDVMAALKAYNAALTFNADFFAGIMGVSRTTASNWLGGKPVKKIKPEQITALREDIIKRRETLAQALLALSE